MLSEQRLNQLLEQITHARLAVIGDFCLDVYWMIEMRASEKSVETGKMTYPVVEQRYSLGGAGNVVANLCALGCGNVRVFPVVGNDPFGQRMLKELQNLGVDDRGAIIAEDPQTWQTLAYCKPYTGTEELSRIDMGNFNALPEELVTRLLSELEKVLPDTDVVVVNQQVITGIHTEALREGLRMLMARHPDHIFLYDSRHHLEAYPLAWLKINDTAASSLCGLRKDPDDLVTETEARSAAAALHARTGRPVFVTRGDRGCVLCEAAGTIGIPGLQVIGTVDTVGAGDSFLAGLAAALAAGASREEAMQMGNFAARVTVAKLRQTGTASADEIRTVGIRPQYVYLPEIADDPRQAHYRPGTRIEVVRELPPRLEVKCAIFDHDGTISTLREGWEMVMTPMMIRAIMGRDYETADEALYRRVADRVAEFIDQTTGIQTLAQMDGLVRLVRDFDMVPQDEILDMHGYKRLYDEALLAKVRERLECLRKGELSRDDFTIKNAVAFVETLADAGVQCYLASGTDEADVRAEAEAMGYAHLFSGGIYGSVGDIHHDAKARVLERIITRMEKLSGHLVTFGDGPVEIRETQMRGGTAVGLASDELRRFGLNPAKRARLIRAGADIIVPDFSQMNELLQILGIGNR